MARSRRLGSSRHAMFLSRRRIERSDGGHVEDVQREAKEKSADGTTGSGVYLPQNHLRDSNQVVCFTKGNEFIQ